jgi:hypothetical protein
MSQGVNLRKAPAVHIWVRGFYDNRRLNITIETIHHLRFGKSRIICTQAALIMLLGAVLAF